LLGMGLPTTANYVVVASLMAMVLVDVGNAQCVTISLDVKFISTTKKDDEIIGFAKILKKTKSMVFLICHLKSKGKMVASASGVWKILKIKPSGLGPGG